MKMVLQKKKLIFIFVLFLLSAFMSVSAAAAYGAEGIDTEKFTGSLPDGARDILGSVSVTEGINSESLLRRLWNKASESFGGVLRDCIRGSVTVVFISMLCSLAQTVLKPKESMPDCVTLVGVLGICTLCISGSGSMVSMASEAIDELYSFSNALLPTLASASAAAGAVTSATVKFAATTLFLDILIGIGDNLIKPLIYAYLAASAASAAFSDKGLRAAAKLIKKLVTFFLCGICLAFTLYLTLTGTIASSADAAAVKLTKTAISTLLPVVGGMVSDAAETVASGVGILKNAIGVFGAIAVLAICLVPFLRLSIGCFAYKAASALSESVAGEKIASVVSAVGDAYGMSLALCGTTAIMLFVSVISAMKAVTG